MADPTAPEKSGAKMVKARVAPRHTVQLENARKGHGPGEEIALPAAEAERLRQRGFLVDPKAEPIPVGSGPTLGNQEGPQITRAA